VRMEGLSYVYCVLVLLTVTQSSRQEGICRFPDVLYGTEHDWRIMSRDKAVSEEHAFQAVTVNQGKLRVDYYRSKNYMEGTSLSVNYQCIEALTDLTYVVRKMTMDQIQYGCIQFIIRNKNVVQWKIGVFHNERTEYLCNADALTLQVAPLVYYHVNGGFWEEERNKYLSNITCPLKGGYVTSWFDSSTQSHQCKDALPPMKVESECELGEGFRFVLPVGEGKPNCMFPSDSQGPVGERYRCLANWIEGVHTYMILVHRDNDFFIPCAVYRTNGGNRFDLTFFKDGVCSPHQNIEEHSDSYLKMTLNKHVVSDECKDMASQCARVECNSVELTQIAACRHTCNLCRQGKLSRQPFPEQFQGSWQKVVAGGDVETWRIDRDRLVLEGMGYQYENIGETSCLSDAGGDPGLGESAIEYTLLSFYDNGCSPRQTSLVVANRSSSILSYRLSQSQVAPIEVGWDGSTAVLDQDVTDWCKKTEYAYDDKPVLGAYHKSAAGWHNLVRSDQGRNSVVCDLPFVDEVAVTMTVKLDYGFTSSCTGSLNYSAGKENVDMSVEHCKRPSFGNQTASITDNSFVCLASFRSDSGKQFIFTRANTPIKHLSSRYMCWVVEDARIVWYPAGMCDAQSRTVFRYYDITDAVVRLRLNLPSSTTRVDISTTASVFSLLIIMYSYCFIS